MELARIEGKYFVVFGSDYGKMDFFIRYGSGGSLTSNEIFRFRQGWADGRNYFVVLGRGCGSMELLFSVFVMTSNRIFRFKFTKTGYLFKRLVTL